MSGRFLGFNGDSMDSNGDFFMDYNGRVTDPDVSKGGVGATFFLISSGIVDPYPSMVIMVDSHSRGTMHLTIDPRFFLFRARCLAPRSV